MSHFTVLIITPDQPTDDSLAAILQPYDENGEESVPNAKWDWWAVGGRWTDFFTLKNGTKADSCRKGDVDFAAKESEVGQRAGARWGTVRQAVGAHMATFVPWSRIIAQYSEQVDVARTVYRGQPAVLALQAAADQAPKNSTERSLLVWAELADYVADRADYVASAQAAAHQTHAILQDGQWTEAGEMGWFAVVSNENDGWPALHRKVLADVPDDHWLTVVDCHI